MTIYGGGLTLNQLGKFVYFSYVKKEPHGEALIPKGFIYLDKNNMSLNNNKFTVLFNPTNIHIIAIHRGTNPRSIRDIGNNVRNFFFVDSKNLITKRNIHAKEGHVELKNFLIKLYKERKENKDKNLDGIIKYIDKLVGDNQDLIEYAVNNLLRNKLTTVGHSQGAIYAYLYGDQGFETIVFNPAPFKGTKPINTHIISNKGDIVSYLTTLKKKDALIKNSKFIKNYVKSKKFSKHSSETILNNFKIVGDPLLLNRDYDNKTKRNNNRNNRNNSKTTKNKNNKYNNNTRRKGHKSKTSKNHA